MIGRKALLAFSVNMLKNAIGYVGIYFVAHRMGPEALGTISFGFAYVAMFNFVADLGFATAHIKKVSEGRDFSVCMGTYLAIRSVLTALMVVAVAVSIVIYKYFLHRSFETPQHEAVIYLAVLTFAATNLANVPSITFAARKETAKQTIPDLIGKVLDAALKVAVAVAGLSVILLAGASVAGAALSLVLYVIVFRGNPIGRPDWQMAKEYFFFAMPVMVIVSSNAVTENLGQIVVQAFWNSEEVGYYSGAGKVTTVFLFAGSAAGTLIFPTLSALNSRRDAQRVRDLTHRAERFMLLLLLPCGVLLTCFSPEIVRLLLGSQFDRAVPVLCILTWSMIVAVVSVPYSTQIIGTGRVRVSAALSVLLMALMVSMNVLFVPRSICGMPWLGWGAPGSAWANLVATVIMAAVYRGFALRITGTGLNVRALKLLPAAAAMALVVYGARHVWSSALAGGAIAVAGSAIYAGAAALLGELTRDDFEYLRSVVSPQRMTSYVMEEFRAGSDAPPAGHEDSNS